MPAPAPRHLRAVGTLGLARSQHCRTAGCPLPRAGALGYCAHCEAVRDAAGELRERLLDRRMAHLQAARPELFDALAPALRSRLLAHVAAQAAHRGEHASVVELAGLEDFLTELAEHGLRASERPT
jgi:hypothetical protein